MKLFKVLTTSFGCLSMMTDATTTDQQNKDIEILVVTATGQLKNKEELTESITLFEGKLIETLAPSHPSELLNRASGVYINDLGGEGHMTSIRQPITTRGVYLFLEDGIPSRPTGFFNHNGLYEINIPQGGGLEVTKGPGTALYGSDAIGGIINTLTQAPSEQLETGFTVEGSSESFRRALLSHSSSVGDHGYRININLTDSQGYRDDADFSRQSYTGRWDIDVNERIHMTHYLSYTHVDQAGSSSLNEETYKNHPTLNTFKDDVGARKIDAVRLSSAIDMQLTQDSQLTLTPFIRFNQSFMMPSWMVTYDPNIRDTTFKTFGLLTKYRLIFDDAEWVAGIDLDYTPSTYKENQVVMIKGEEDGLTTYIDYVIEGLNYHFDATQQSISPFVHMDWALTDRLRFSAGLRYDYFTVDYRDQLKTVGDDSRHLRQPSQNVNYDSWSPKLGLVYTLNDAHNTYINYRHAFRSPTVGELFRSGSNEQTASLKPVHADSVELGFRGAFMAAFNYELALYYMLKQDDIVSIINDETRETINAGETEHVGIELLVHGELTDELSYHIAGSYTKQRYKTFQYFFQCFSSNCGRASDSPPIQETRKFDGNIIAQAPKTLANSTLVYMPRWGNGLRIEGEWEHVGDYFVDDTNTESYGGHNLFNVRVNYPVIQQVELFAKVKNVANTLYSTRSAKQPNASETFYRPGLPRTYYLGMRVNF